MTHIQLHGPLTVDAMAPVPLAVRDRLRELLASGVDVLPDAGRPNFYTLNHESLRVYFYISPVSAKVWVLEGRLVSSAPEALQAAAQSA